MRLSWLLQPQCQWPVRRVAARQDWFCTLGPVELSTDASVAARAEHIGVSVMSASSIM
jgi:hypothetical protein